MLSANRAMVISASERTFQRFRQLIAAGRDLRQADEGEGVLLGKSSSAHVDIPRARTAGRGQRGDIGEGSDASAPVRSRKDSSR